MNFSMSSHLFAFSFAPLALVLSACNDTADGDAGAMEGDAIAAIPAPDGGSWTDQVAVTEEGGYLLGNPDAPVKLIEYASLTCPACASFAANGAETLKSEYVNTGVVSFELRNQIHGPDDLALVGLARCGSDESYHPLSDQVWANLQTLLAPIYENREAAQQALQLPENERFPAFAEVAGFYDFFAARGLSQEQARQCLADFASLEGIANNSQTQSQELDVTGTPTFFVNGNKVDTNTWAGLEPILQRAGARQE